MSLAFWQNYYGTTNPFIPLSNQGGLQPPNIPLFYYHSVPLTLILQWGRGVRSSRGQSIEGIPAQFTIHGLCSNRLNFRPPFLDPFDPSFGGNPRTIRDTIYHWPNLDINQQNDSYFDRVQSHNEGFWGYEWFNHWDECHLTQDQYFRLPLVCLESWHTTLYDAMMFNSVDDPPHGRRILDVAAFQRVLAQDGLFPSFHTTKTPGIKTLLELKIKFELKIDSNGLFYTKGAKNITNRAVLNGQVYVIM